MGLRDTIGGALKEASDGGFEMPGSGKADGAKDKDSSGKASGTGAADAARPKGGTPRSASRARPARELRGSVRTEQARSTAAKAYGTKEERKAERQKERDREDLVMAASRVLQKRDEEYARTGRVWWWLMGLGFGFTMLSVVINYLIFPNSSGGAVQAFSSIISLVLAYGFIIAAFIYDLAKRGKIRRRCDSEAKGMSERRIRQLIEEDMAEEAAKRAESEAKKAAKKAAREEARAKK